MLNAVVYEAAGTVEAIGEGVEGFQVGDAVSVIPAFSMNDYAHVRTLGARPGAGGGQALRLFVVGSSRRHLDAKHQGLMGL